MAEQFETLFKSHTRATGATLGTVYTNLDKTFGCGEGGPTLHENLSHQPQVLKVIASFPNHSAAVASLLVKLARPKEHAPVRCREDVEREVEVRRPLPIAAELQVVVHNDVRHDHLHLVRHEESPRASHDECSWAESVPVAEGSRGMRTYQECCPWPKGM